MEIVLERLKKYSSERDIIKYINQYMLMGGNIRQYVLALKEQELGGLKCELCGKRKKGLNVHHKRYGLDVNYYDLELLCSKCHDIKHQ